ncbi:MAG: SRPBCC family protein [Marinomonas sp.]
MIPLTNVSLSIEQDIDTVFAYATNLENYANWFEGVIDIKSANNLGQFELGKTYQETLLINGQEAMLTIKVHECSQPNLFVTQGDLAGFLPQMNMSFERLAEQETLFHLAYASRETTIAKDDAFLTSLKADLTVRAQKAVLNLKRILESH